MYNKSLSLSKIHIHVTLYYKELILAMTGRLYFIILQVIVILGEDTNESKGLQCCPHIRVSSTSYADEHQPSSLGIYNALPGKTNNRLVYKHNSGKFT